MTGEIFDQCDGLACPLSFRITTDQSIIPDTLKNTPHYFVVFLYGLEEILWFYKEDGQI